MVIGGTGTIKATRTIQIPSSEFNAWMLDQGAICFNPSAALPLTIFDVDNVRIVPYPSPALNPDGSENRKSPKDRGEDERGESAGFLPGDVTCPIFGPDSSGVANLQESRSQVTKGQRQLIAASGLLQNIPYPEHFDAKGTEHTVRFRGRLVEKHQHSNGWTAFLNDAGLLSIRPALPTEYLRRME